MTSYKLLFLFAFYNTHETTIGSTKTNDCLMHWKIYYYHLNLDLLVISKLWRRMFGWPFSFNVYVILWESMTVLRSWSVLKYPKLLSTKRLGILLNSYVFPWNQREVLKSIEGNVTDSQKQTETDSFNVKFGVHQGSTLSYFLSWPHYWMRR